MKIKIALLVVFAFIMPVANASLQQPNWGIGDYWNYSGSYSVNEDITYGNMSANVKIDTDDMNIRLDVVNVEMVVVNGGNIPSYKTKLTASSSGTILIEGQIGGKKQSFSGTYNMTAHGYIYFSVDGIKVVKNDITMNASTNLPIPNMPSGEMSVTIEYYPPLDFMNFPVDVKEKWTARSNATVYFGDMKQTSPVTFSFECVSRQGDIYIIKSDYNPFGEMIPFNNTLVFWDGSVGMIKSIKDIGGSQDLDFQLKDYKYSNFTNTPPTVTISFEPPQPKAGTNILFKSNVDDKDGNVVSYFWQFGDGSNSTQPNPSHVYTEAGTYTVTLTVMDNFGASTTATITVNVEGGNGGGGSTPGFEFVFVVIVLAVLIFLKKNRHV
ncbi:MAG: PKD domain-containing protein [Thermoplasmata archaeon]|nr:PKD domain-containing protein [Thermoplasmata archaeon]